MIDSFSPPEGLSYCYITLARQAMLNEQLSEAESLLIHAEQLAHLRGWSGALAPLLAERIKLCIQSDNTAQARHLLNPLQELARQNQSANNRLISWHLDLSRSRLMLADGEPLLAAEHLYSLVAEQEQCGEWLSAVHSRLLLTVALWRAGETDQAITVCKSALQQVLPQNLLRSLLDTGPELLLLLNHLRKQQELRDEFSNIITQLWSMLSATDISHKTVDPDISSLKLTEREQQTLRLIAEGYANKSIARALGISAETVKWHLKHLYQKLQASNRTQAVNQARKWHLLN